MPQLAKNALQTERVLLLLRGENLLNSTYKNKIFDPTLSPNIANVTFNIKAKWLHSKIARRAFW